MPSSTPAAADFNVEDFDDDVSLGANEASPITLANYSATDDISGVIIYGHGCSARVKLNVPKPVALAALARCGWSPEPSSSWKSSNPTPRIRRYVVRGSKWLDERPPKNTRLPLVGLNRLWKTHLYSLGIEIQGDEVHVDVQVVRHDDLRRFFEEVLCLQTNDYTISYYRTVERYVVLPPHEAFRLAEQLGAVPKNGGGRLARKRYLVKDHEIPIVIRERTKAIAHLVSYRIDRGATAVYKVEVRLRGRRRDRGEFHEKDIEKLDNVLLDLLSKYDLKTIPKPARWEPRTFTTSAERGSFDTHMKQLPEKAWRGRRIPDVLKRTVRKCHTPGLVKLVACSRDNGIFPRSARIRSDISTSPCSSPTFTTTGQSTGSTWKCIAKQGVQLAHYMLMNNEQKGEVHHSNRAPDPWSRLVSDIAKSRLYLHEVTLDPQQNPGPLLHALAEGVLGHVGIAGMCAVDASGHADTWQSVIEATKSYPFENDDLDTLVIVIDPSAMFDVASAVVGEIDPKLTEDGEIDFDNIFGAGPLMPPENAVPGTDALPTLVKATGAWLADLFEELRRVGEETGIRFVILTCDARPEHGRGPLQRSHYFRDGRVRSSIGDAGRHYAHMRYLVERAVKTTRRTAYTEVTYEGGETIIHKYDERIDHEPIVGNIVIIKDEAEGLTGRLVYKAPISPPERRWKRRKSL